MASYVRSGGCLAAKNWMKGVFGFTKIGSIQLFQRIGSEDSRIPPLRLFSSSHQMHVRSENSKISSIRHDMRLTKTERLKDPTRAANALILVAENQFHGPGIIDRLEQKWHRHRDLDDQGSGTFSFSESRIDFWNRVSVDKRAELIESLDIVLRKMNSSRHPIFSNLPVVEKQGRNYLDTLGASVHTVQCLFDLGWKTDEVFPFLMISPEMFRDDIKLFAVLAALCESCPVYWSQDVYYF